MGTEEPDTESNPAVDLAFDLIRVLDPNVGDDRGDVHLVALTATVTASIEALEDVLPHELARAEERVQAIKSASDVLRETLSRASMAGMDETVRPKDPKGVPGLAR